MQIILSVLLGGKGTIWGPVLGAFIIEPFNEFANNTLGGGNSRLVIFGGVLVLVVLLLPQGIIPTVTKTDRPPTGSAERPGLTGSRIELCERPRPATRPEPSAVNVLEVRNLNKRFGGLQAVDGLLLRGARGFGDRSYRPQRFRARPRSLTSSPG